MKFFSLILVGLMTLASMDADAARRFGGGKSFGKQSGNVTQREAAPTAPGGAAQNAAAKPAPASAAPGAAGAVAPKRPWGAMLGGLAAGLGLAWLAHSLGLGAEFGQILLFGLLALAVMAVIGMVMRARAGGVSRGRSPYAFQGAADASNTVTPSQYSPDKVGNDASARPWERGATAFQSNAPVSGSTGSIIGSALSGGQNWGVPAGFDAEGFLAAAKRNFVTLQDAWDRSDVATLRSMMTDEMVGEIKSQLAEREAQQDGQPNQTDVVTLEAQLLGIEDLGDGYMASVEFTGIIREQPSAGPSPFREVWNMTKPKAGSSGWLVAGVQALQ
ncbi:MAG: 39S ribosomal protein L45 [Burkholderiales bacterium]|nr:39S ribosomal protein L45 [Burkholderiales bacterium]